MKFSPSLMCLDGLDVRKDIEEMNPYADAYHIDIMDGHFVPNLAIAPSLVASLRPITKVPLDCHLMVEHPEQYIDTFLDAGADSIGLHAETISGQAFRLIARIKERGCKAGVVLNPETPFSMVHHYIHLCDRITIMTVDPGFAGQTFLWDMMDKIKEIGAYKKEHGLSLVIEADGGCGPDTYKPLTDAGVDVLIMGTAGFFGLDESLATSFAMLHKAYEDAIG